MILLTKVEFPNVYSSQVSCSKTSSRDNMSHIAWIITQLDGKSCPRVKGMYALKMKKVNAEVKKVCRSKVKPLSASTESRS